MSEERKEDGKLEFWAMVELFGHQKIAGFVREVTLGGDVLLRIDVPEIQFTRNRYGAYGEPTKTESITIAPFTKLYSPQSIFSMTPVSEETCRQMMASLKVEPIVPFEPRALPAPSTDDDDDEYAETG